jgi:hypothetical protein
MIVSFLTRILEFARIAARPSSSQTNPTGLASLFSAFGFCGCEFFELNEANGGAAGRREHDCRTADPQFGAMVLNLVARRGDLRGYNIEMESPASLDEIAAYYGDVMTHNGSTIERETEKRGSSHSLSKQRSYARSRAGSCSSDSGAGSSASSITAQPQGITTRENRRKLRKKTKSSLFLL